MDTGSDYLTFWYQFQHMHMCIGGLGEFHIAASSSRTPAGCPTIQLNSGNIYLGMVSEPTY